MYRPAVRSLLLRQLQPPLRTLPRRQFLSTAPPAQKSRSWKSSAARWGLAVVGIYYYNTSTVFAEEPPFYPPRSASSNNPAETLPTLDSLKPSRPSDDARTPHVPPSTHSGPDASDDVSTNPTSSPSSSLKPESSSSTATENPDVPSMPDTATEADQQGAFNEETGEINWDCPCLGGMAHGPCGPEFREAFSCFVFSKEEPKGMDCIDRFKGMQDCFREHPDVYGGELDDEDEDLEGLNEPDDGLEESGERREGSVEEKDGEKGLAGRPAGESGHTVTQTGEVRDGQGVPAVSSRDERADSQTTDTAKAAKAAKTQVQEEHGVTEGQSESDALVPKAAHDATGANTGKSTEK